MKQQTADFIRAMPLDKQQEIVRFMAQIMSVIEFCDALEKPRKASDDPELSSDGKAILDKLTERHQAEAIDLEEALADYVDPMHEAICEGRAQDALDLLNAAVPSAHLRDVATQNRLFPHRVMATELKDLL